MDKEKETTESAQKNTEKSGRKIRQKHGKKDGRDQIKKYSRFPENGYIPESGRMTDRRRESRIIREILRG